MSWLFHISTTVTYFRQLSKRQSLCCWSVTPESPLPPDRQCQQTYSLNVSGFPQTEPIETHFTNLFKLLILTWDPNVKLLGSGSCPHLCLLHTCTYTALTHARWLGSDTRVHNNLDTDVWLVIYFWEESQKLRLMKRLLPSRNEGKQGLYLYYIIKQHYTTIPWKLLIINWFTCGFDPKMSWRFVKLAGFWREPPEPCQTAVFVDPLSRCGVLKSWAV